MVNTRSTGENVFKVFNVTLMVLLGLATFYPFWYVLVASFNTGSDYVKGGVYLWPRAFTLGNYQVALRDPRIFASLRISAARTIIGTCLSIFFTALIAYAVLVETLPGRTAFTFFFYFTTLVAGGLIPNYMLFRALGLTRSFLLYVLPGIYSFFYFLLMRTYFKTIPKEMMESAQMDGASHFKILFQIYVPNAMPVIATIALFVGVGHWNDWFTAAYYQINLDLWPAATVLQALLRDVSQHATTAFVMLLTMPIVFVYPFLQKYYVRGVMIGAVKG